MTLYGIRQRASDYPHSFWREWVPDEGPSFVTLMSAVVHRDSKDYPGAAIFNWKMYVGSPDS